MLKRLLLALAVLGLLIMLFFWAALNWSYSTGERAGWVQKLSKKGWVCKTWEGELALVSLPGAMPERFLFTIRDDAVAEAVTRAMGKRVSLHYEEKVGLPTTCFGETRHYVTKVIPADEIPLAPGVTVPAPGTATPAPTVPAPAVTAPAAGALTPATGAPLPTAPVGTAPPLPGAAPAPVGSTPSR